MRYGPNVIANAASAPLWAFVHTGDGSTLSVLAIVLEIMESGFNHFIESSAIVYVMEQRLSGKRSGAGPGRPAAHAGSVSSPFSITTVLIL